MNKEEYVVEMLSEELEQYQIPRELILECASAVVHGLDMWYELSGDGIATSNRYSSLEAEKREVIEKGRKEVEQVEAKHKKELDEIDRYVRYRNQKYLERIQELEKQIR